jgi:hypothetical protein
MEEHLEPNDIEVVGVEGGPSLTGDEEPEEKEEVEEAPVSTEPEEAEAAPAEEEEEPAAEEVESEEEEPEVDEPPEVTPEDLKAQLAELEETIAARKERAEYWKEQKALRRREYFQPPGAEIPEEEPPAPAEIDYQAVLGPKPKQDDFETYEEYYEALADYRADVKILQFQAQQHNQGQIREIEMFKETVIEAGTAKYEDFEEVARDPALAITGQMLDAMRELDAPEDVAYYLGRHPNEAIKIARMTPAGMGRALTQLEFRIQQEVTSTPPIEPTSPQPKRKTSGAPPPVRPVKGGAEQVSKDPDKMSPEEYREWRERGEGD